MQNCNRTHDHKKWMKRTDHSLYPNLQLLTNSIRRITKRAPQQVLNPDYSLQKHIQKLRAANQTIPKSLKTQHFTHRFFSVLQPNCQQLLPTTRVLSWTSTFLNPHLSANTTPHIPSTSFPSIFTTAKRPATEATPHYTAHDSGPHTHTDTHTHTHTHTCPCPLHNPMPATRKACYTLSYAPSISVPSLGTTLINTTHVEVERELVALAQRTDFGHMRWTRPKHALEVCSLQLLCSSSCV
jgi:hypothetical protein